MLYIVNAFYRAASQTIVLRDEDINFPPTTDQFSPKEHPILKEVTLDNILQALKESSTAEFAPYLSWIHSLVQATACALERGYLDGMKVKQSAAN